MDTGVFADYGQRPPAMLPPEEAFQPGLLAELAGLGERLALDANQPEVTSCHLLCALGQCRDPAAPIELRQLGLDPEQLHEALLQTIPPPARDAVLIGHPQWAADAQAALHEAVQEAEHLQQSPAGWEHLLLTLLNSAAVVVLLHHIHFDPRPARNALRARLEGRRSRAEA
jgi:ATP-dependent Clp protease ATP-binding subunit ClpA